jgi:AcrR family transcriptional regulator
MSVEDRRESILDAAMPLLKEQGAEVTTKQIADAAGIAEGTIFRAFADKHDLVNAAVARYMDPEPTLAMLRAIDTELPLEQKVLAVVEIISSRFRGVVGIMNALGVHHGPPPGMASPHPGKGVAAPSRTATEALFEPDAERLRMSPAEAVHFIRLLCFANSVPTIAAARDLSTEDLADFILRGIAKEGQ